MAQFFKTAIPICRNPRCVYFLHFTSLADINKNCDQLDRPCVSSVNGGKARRSDLRKQTHTGVSASSILLPSNYRFPSEGDYCVQALTYGIDKLS